jgi:hypothetical protein
MPRCGVCLDDCGEKNIAITECGHTTHIECLIRVLSTSDNCIYCRKKLNLQNNPLDKPGFEEIRITQQFEYRRFDDEQHIDDDDRPSFIKMFWEKFSSMFYEQLLYAFKLCVGICLIAVIILFA